MAGDILEGLVTFGFLMLPVVVAGVVFLLSEHVGFFRRVLRWIIESVLLNDEDLD